VTTLTASAVAGAPVKGLITYTGYCAPDSTLAVGDFQAVTTIASWAALPVLSDGAQPTITAIPYTNTEGYGDSAHGGTAIFPTKTVGGSNYAYVHDSGNDVTIPNAQTAAWNCGNPVGGTFRAYAYISFTPSVAGTYSVSLYDPDHATYNSPIWTVTVAAAPSLSLSASTGYALGTDTTTAGYYTQSNLLANDATGYLSAAKAVGTFAGAVAVYQSNGSTQYPIVDGGAGKVSATVSGSGLIYVADVTTACDATAAASAARAMTSGSKAVTQKICIFADGTAGTGTISWSVGTTALGSTSVTFYGAAAKYTPTVVYSVIEQSGTFTAASTTGVSNSNRKAVKVKVTDSNGNPVVGAKVYMNSSDTSIISGTYQPDKYAGSDAYGYAYFDLTGNAAGTAKLSFTNKMSAFDPSITTSNPEITAGPVEVRVGSTKPDSISVSFDQSNYKPGQVATITVKILDAKGAAVPRGKYSVFNSALSTNYSLSGGSTPGTAVATATCVDALGVPGTAAATCAAGYVQTRPVLNAGDVWISGSDGTATFTVNMPSTPGTVTLSGTISTYLPNGLGTSANAGTAISATAIVDDPNSDAVDAANEATDAANAATDAANAAAEAADAATAAAQDAQAAVADLAAQVATLIAGIKAQITSLTNLVIKIQKKVKA